MSPMSFPYNRHEKTEVNSRQFSCPVELPSTLPLFPPIYTSPLFPHISCPNSPHYSPFFLSVYPYPHSVTLFPFLLQTPT